ncbi:unnamed protein product [Chironomus riparius]|uniref:Uncharacterized protein n=1 Tax=Chironomus riparius TaxID=315576 RepID=A0A9N9RR92_9DIPT|nr:unnamed protein product [Chironomus riparius]
MDIENYDQVANKIHYKLPKVNKLLANCELNTQLAIEGIEEKLNKVFSINTSDIIVKGRSRKCHDLSKVSSMIKKLNIRGKPTSDMPKKKVRSGSTSSIASDDSNRDYKAEIQSHLKDMRKIIESIHKTSIKEDDGNSAFETVTTSHNNFLQLVFGLQKIANEMAVIASNDSVPSDNPSLSFIDDELIDQLKQLDKCLSDMQKLYENKNPVTNLEKKQNLKLEYTSIINNILGTINNNPH